VRYRRPGVHDGGAAYRPGGDHRATESIRNSATLRSDHTQRLRPVRGQHASIRLSAPLSTGVVDRPVVPPEIDGQASSDLEDGTGLG